MAKRGARAERLGRPPRPPQALGDLTRQRINIHPMREPVLFSVYPPYAADVTHHVQYDQARQQLLRGSINEILASTEPIPRELRLRTPHYWHLAGEAGAHRPAALRWRVQSRSTLANAVRGASGGQRALLGVARPMATALVGRAAPEKS